LANQNASVASVRKFEIATFVILCIILAGSGVIVFMPINYTVKLSIGLGLVCLSILSALIISYAFTQVGISTYETFSSALVSDVANIINSDGITNTELVIFNANTYYYGQVSDYLTNTINLANTLQSYNVYGGVNKSLDKEQLYYKNTTAGLENVNARIQSVYKLSFLTQAQTTALMNFFMAVSIISAATIMGYVAVADKYDTLAQWVLAIGVFLILCALTIYIMEVSQRVRTDGDKMYWGQPSIDYTNQIS
jgi:hypothetical protein